ncbi:MAG: aminotransferase class V-fold PLP-dependent enzyme [Anaerolineaceae bacterium]|nr:aminotransferase class V-fold PLP-dependent enzyme [Anaerolineaceae bacterium]
MSLIKDNTPSAVTPDGAIYFDSAATSWPKPPGVAAAMLDYLERVGANPGRSGHRASIEAGRIMYQTRELVAETFNCNDPMRVAFTLNITQAINLVLQRLLKPGDHVLTSSMEHNSVMRPLRALEHEGVELNCVACDVEGKLNPVDLEKLILPHTRLIVLNHASNVSGTILPLREVAEITRKHNILLLVDAAQTAGVLPIDIQADQIDFLTFTGHKSLYGPTGTGGVIFGERVDIEMVRPLTRGGTGSRSEREEQPDFLPDRFESGTQNVVGLAGLGASLKWLQELGISELRLQEEELCAYLLHGLKGIPGITIYGPKESIQQTATVAINLAGYSPAELGLILDDEYGILCRAGLHCAPAAHRTLGTFPTGSVRISLGAFHQKRDIDSVLQALQNISRVNKP